MSIILILPRVSLASSSVKRLSQSSKISLKEKFSILSGRDEVAFIYILI